VKPRWYITTRDFDFHEWTPQIGLPEGPYIGWRKLLKAARRLATMGYSGLSDVSVLVFSIECSATGRVRRRGGTFAAESMKRYRAFLQGLDEPATLFPEGPP
jgi:hypothetical protein